MRTFLTLLIALILVGCNASTRNAKNSFMSATGLQDVPETKYIDTLPPSTFKAKEQSNSSETDPAQNVRVSLDYELMDNPSMENYLEGIKNKLLAQWPGKLSHNVGIFVNTGRVYSAYSTPTDIVLTMGVIADVESEDELAFIISHELSHILLGHHNINSFFKSQEKVVNTASKMAMTKAKLEDYKVVRSGNSVSVQEQNKSSTQNRINEAYKAALAVNRLNQDVVHSKMSRKVEQDADLLAVDLLVKAGYSAFGYGSALERMESSMVFSYEQLQKKKAEFRGLVAELAFEEGTEGQDLISDLKILMATEVLGSSLQFLSRRHKSTEKRQLVLAKYVKQEYRKERRRRLQQEQLEKSLRKGSTKQILANYWSASEALRALDNGEIKEAEKLARKSVSGATSGHVYPRVAFYSVRDTQGNSSKALANINRIKNWDYASTQTFLVASQNYRKNKQYTKAYSILDKAEKIIGIKDPVYPELISIHMDRGKQDEALQSLEECNQVNEKQIREQCQEAAGSLASNSTEGEPGFLSNLKKTFTQ